MKRICSIGILAGLAALLVAPTLAQPPATNPPSASASVNPKPAGSNATVPSGSLQKVRNDWRGRTLIGTVVFNDNGQRIASINDLLITDDGRVDQVILSVGRIRGKLVAVPFNQLRFAPSGNFLPTGVVAADGAASPIPSPPSDQKVYGAVLPGATRDSLAKMETFRFSP
jgi:PRC-barrel domain